MIDLMQTAPPLKTDEDIEFMVNFVHQLDFMQEQLKDQKSKFLAKQAETVTEIEAFKEDYELGPEQTSGKFHARYLNAKQFLCFHRETGEKRSAIMFNDKSRSEEQCILYKYRALE